MSDLVIPVLITLLIICLVGVVLRLDKVFFKRRGKRDDFEGARPVVGWFFGDAADVQEAWIRPVPGGLQSSKAIKLKLGVVIMYLGESLHCVHEMAD